MLPTARPFSLQVWAGSAIVRHSKTPFIEYFDLLEELRLALLGR